MQRSLRMRLSILFISIATIPILIVGALVTQQSIKGQTAQAIARQDEIANRVAQTVATFIIGQEKELRILTDVQTIQTLPIEEQKLILSKAFNASDIYEQLTLTDNTGKEKIRITRTEIVPDRDLIKRNNEVAFQRPIATKNTYYSTIFFNDNLKEPYITISIPLLGTDNTEIIGVIIAELRFQTIWDLMAQESGKDSLAVYLLDNGNKLIAHPDSSLIQQSIIFTPPSLAQVGTGLLGERAVLSVAPVSLGDIKFTVIAELPYMQAIVISIKLLEMAGIALIIVLIAISIFSFWETRQIVQPLEAMVNAASAISTGNLEKRVTIKNKDEIGTLGVAFNEMAAQIQELLSGMEQRVAERTTELEMSSSKLERRAGQMQAISDVARSIASVQDLNQLLPEIARVISERFGFYHTGIFLKDKNGEYAVLRAANSPGGQRMLARNHQLKIGLEGLVGNAIARSNARIALDVGDDAVFFNNPDLPDTRSEMALPLIVNGQTIGALDVQSLQAGAFKDEDIDVLLTLADQVAVAIENARLFDVSEQTRAELEASVAGLTKNSWRDYINRHQVTGYRAAQEELLPLSQHQVIDDDGALVLPVKLRGVVIGKIGIRGEAGNLDEYDEYKLAVVQAAAERMALALENARLFDDARKRADRERAISDISAQISAESSINDIMRRTVEELSKTLGADKLFFQLRPNDTNQSEAKHV